MFDPRKLPLKLGIQITLEHGAAAPLVRIEMLRGTDTVFSGVVAQEIAVAVVYRAISSAIEWASSDGGVGPPHG